jgi:hypothetical protein
MPLKIKGYWSIKATHRSQYNEPSEFESDNEITEVEIDLLLSIQEKPVRAIDKEMNFYK